MADTDPGSLDRLHDIAVPPPVSWWPLASGWWVVVGIGLVLFAVVVVVAISRWHRDRYRREALRELAHLPRSGNLVPAVAELLKRVALAAYPRDQVASLTGDKWLQFLNATGGTEDFSRYPGTVLGDAEYQPDPRLMDTKTPQLFDVVRHWIAHHRC